MLKFHTVLMVVLLSPGLARPNVVSYECNTFPGDEGWERSDRLFLPDRWLDDGWFVQHAELVDPCPPLCAEDDFYRRSIAEFAGAASFFLEWVVETDGPEAFWDVAPASIVASGTSGVKYHFTIARDQARLIRDSQLPIVYADIVPDLAHKYRLELYGAVLYAWYVDGVLIDSGVPEGPFPSSDSRIIWGTRASILDNTTRWNYIRYGTIPADASGDYDGDGLADLADFYFFEECYEGSGVDAGPGCRFADFDGDTDVDLDDFNAFLGVYTGPLPDCNANDVLDLLEILNDTGQDCNSNDILDECDITNGTSQDCNMNGIPDDCEPDCNDNNVADSCDIAEGTSQDCNTNGVPDDCEPDCNTNDVADSCDIAGGTSQDCSANQIPDECEADCNGNGVADSCDIADGTSGDWNEDGVPDECSIIYVDADAAGLNNGTNWTNAFPDLKDAVSASMRSMRVLDDIWVAAGTYSPARQVRTREATFRLYSDIALYGGFAGNETLLGQRDVHAHVTVLTGDRYGNDAGDWNDPSRAENSYHVVRTDYVLDTTVLDGFAITGGNANGGEYKGAGMHNNFGEPQVRNCTFIGNVASYDGGGMYNTSGSRVTLTNCAFVGNRANALGGGLYNSTDCETTLVNCMFGGNTGGEAGGAIFNYRNNLLTLTNCTFSSNFAPNGRALAFDSYEQQYPSLAQLANCILWDGGNEIWSNDDSTTVATFSDIYGGWAGTGNIDGDPLFADADGPDNISGTVDDDLRVSPGSPCIDAGDNEAVPEGITTDLDGNERFVDDPSTPDTGNGTPPMVDMGAYEFGSSSPSGAIPVVSDWGMVVMTLLVLTAGTLVFVRRRAVEA